MSTTVQKHDRLKREKDLEINDGRKQEQVKIKKTKKGRELMKY